jgi:hypothetical protein
MTSEQAKELKQTILWEGLCSEINLMVEGAKDHLVTCKPEDTPKFQERIKALRSIISLPQDVIDREEE